MGAAPTPSRERGPLSCFLAPCSASSCHTLNCVCEHLCFISIYFVHLLARSLCPKVTPSSLSPISAYSFHGDNLRSGWQGILYSAGNETKVTCSGMCKNPRMCLLEQQARRQNHGESTCFMCSLIHATNIIVQQLCAGHFSGHRETITDKINQQNRYCASGKG